MYGTRLRRAAQTMIIPRTRTVPDNRAAIWSGKCIGRLEVLGDAEYCVRMKACIYM
jgi:hypothetical protein